MVPVKGKLPPSREMCLVSHNMPVASLERTESAPIQRFAFSLVIAYGKIVLPIASRVGCMLLVSCIKCLTQKICDFVK